MTSHIFYAHTLDTPEDPFKSGQLRAEEVALVVADGVIAFRGPLADAQRKYPDLEVTTLPGLLLPGLVDTHVHFPQLRIIGGLGMPLLDWLDHCALPEEARMADLGYAQAVADQFVRGLVRAGTTTALTFGAHFASATDALFHAAHGAGIRMTTGLVLGDCNLREDLHTTHERAITESADLITRWHRQDRLRYAVTPRFALSASDELLRACHDLSASAEGLFLTSHVNENPAEVSAVASMFPKTANYTDVYDQYDLLGRRTVLAHNVHPETSELERLAATNTSVAHCPTSNSSLGSGLFPMRAHLDADVHLALGSDVGGGTGLSLFKEGLQAYFHQQVQSDGVALTPAHLLYLATKAGAQALDRPEIGQFDVGYEFDAIHIDPAHGSTFETVLRHAADAPAALSAVFTLGTDADITQVWIGGVSS